MHKAIKYSLTGLLAVASLPVIYFGGSVLALEASPDIPGHYRMRSVTSTRLQKMVLAEGVDADFAPRAERKTPLLEGEEFNCDLQVIHPAPGDAIEFSLLDQAGKELDQDRKVIPTEGKNQPFWLNYSGPVYQPGRYTCRFRTGSQTAELPFEVREVQGLVFAEAVLAEEIDPQSRAPRSVHQGKVAPGAPFVCDVKVLHPAPGDEVKLSLIDEDGEAIAQDRLVFPQGTAGKAYWLTLDGKTKGSGHYTCRYQHGAQVREVPVEVGPSEPSQLRLVEAVLADRVAKDSRPLSLKTGPLRIGEVATCSLQVAQARKGDVLKVSLLDEQGAVLRQEKVAMPHDLGSGSTWAQFQNPVERPGRYTCRFQHGDQTLEVPFQVAAQGS